MKQILAAILSALLFVQPYLQCRSGNRSCMRMYREKQKIMMIRKRTPIRRTRRRQDAANTQGTAEGRMPPIPKIPPRGRMPPAQEMRPDLRSARHPQF